MDSSVCTGRTQCGSCRHRTLCSSRPSDVGSVGAAHLRLCSIRLLPAPRCSRKTEGPYHPWLRPTTPPGDGLSRSHCLSHRVKLHRLPAYRYCPDWEIRRTPQHVLRLSGAGQLVKSRHEGTALAGGPLLSSACSRLPPVTLLGLYNAPYSGPILGQETLPRAAAQWFGHEQFSLVGPGCSLSILAIVRAASRSDLRVF